MYSFHETVFWLIQSTNLVMSIMKIKGCLDVSCLDNCLVKMSCYRNFRLKSVQQSSNKKALGL